MKFQQDSLSRPSRSFEWFALFYASFEIVISVRVRCITDKWVHLWMDVILTELSKSLWYFLSFTSCSLLITVWICLYFLSFISCSQFITAWICLLLLTYKYLKLGPSHPLDSRILHFILWFKVVHCDWSGTNDKIAHILVTHYIW